MNMKRACLASVLSMMAVMPAAAATEGWYLSVEGGGSWVKEWEQLRTLQTYCGPEFKNALAEFDTGTAAFGAAGFGIAGWRFELEGGYRQNDLTSFVMKWWGPRQDGEGQLTEYSAMINVLYDVPLFDRFSLTVGVGAGADFASVEMDTYWGPVDVDDWRFAYQGIAGLNYAITELTVLFVNYRFANVRDINLEPTDRYSIDGGDFEKHAATAGVRFALAGPAAAPPPPPPEKQGPVPLEREFIVFFGFNRSDLTPQALGTIRKAVGSVRDSGSAAIRVVGHADRAGSISYNKALSVRRASSVKKALIAEGISAGTISVSGRGESEPAVPTADGVREPQNRRVHISF